MYRSVSEDIRKVAHSVLAAEGALTPQDAAKVMDEVSRILKQKAGKPVTAADVEAGGLAQTIAMALLLGLGAMAPSKAEETVDFVKQVSDSLSTIRTEVGGELPGPMQGSLAGIRVTMHTKAQRKAYDTINALDKKLAEGGMKQEDRAKALGPLIKSMGMTAQ